MSKIEDVLKCDICNKNFDITNKRPFIAKCGHTFCKHCILSYNNENNNCPLDNIQSVLSIESCIPNLKLEEVIRIIFFNNNNNEEKTIEKKIIYMKPEIKRNKSPIQRNELAYSQKNFNVYNKKIRSSTANKYSTEFKFIHNEPMYFGNTNTNMKTGKVEFEDSKINDEINETIETIPPNDEKNIINLSFKDEMNILLKKNTTEMKMNENNNNDIEINNDNFETNNKETINYESEKEKEKEIINKKDNNHRIFDMDDSLDKISRIDDEFITNANNNTNDININFSANPSQLNSSTKIEKDLQENLKKITKNIQLDFQKINNNSNTVSSATYYKISNNKPFNLKMSEKNSLNLIKDKSQTSNLTPRKYNNVFISNSSYSKNNSEQTSRYYKNKSVAPYKHQYINNSNSINLTNITLNNNMKTDRIIEEENDDHIKKNISLLDDKGKIKNKENSYISAYNPHTNFKIKKITLPQKSNNNLILNNNLTISNNGDSINTSPKKKKEITKEEIKIKLIKELEKQNKNQSTQRKYIEYIEKALSNPKIINSQNKLKDLTLKIISPKEIIIGFQDENNQNIKYGIQYSQNGDYYEGEFVNNKKEGNGKLILKNGTIYEGSFKNNKHNGYGKLTQLDGEIFAGEWKEGKIDGNGIRYHSNGDKYIGNYKNNLKHGIGHYIFSNGNSYDGNWENGKANGKGKFIFKNGNFYEGEFKDNIISGNGIFTMKNGDCYIGIFKNGLINGRGIFKNNKGEKFNGFFSNGKKHGMGKLYDKDGNLIASGYWNMDKFVGKKIVNEFI